MDFSKYKYVVAYGIGQYYDHIINSYDLNIKFDYLCDKSFNEIGPVKDGIEVISPEKLKSLENTLVVIFSGNPRNHQSIISVLKNMGHDYMHINELSDFNKIITGAELKRLSSPYKDNFGNTIEFSKDIEDTVNISFLGKDNKVVIASNVSVGSLNINCAKGGIVKIDEGTEIVGLKIYATNGSVSIGKDCLFSYDIIIRNDDGHHIFDSKTGERINFAGNIDIADHVWVGQGATILKNFSIGTNSVVGAKTVTSSKFPKEVVVAGNPGKITRGNVCWSKDFTNFYNHSNLDECMAQEAKKYL